METEQKTSPAMSTTNLDECIPQYDLSAYEKCTHETKDSDNKKSSLIPK